MSTNIIVTKDEYNQQLIPTIWRGALRLIVEAIKSNKYQLIKRDPSIKDIDSSDVMRINDNIEEYGCTLIELPEETWENSVCQWMQGYWDVLVELYTAEEGRSDLILDVRVYEQKHGFEYEVISVHVE